MARKRAVDVLSGLKGKFVELPRRLMIQIDMDMADDPDSMDVKLQDSPEDALVKIRMRHHRGDEEIANAQVNVMTDWCRKNGAYHVFRPEMVVVGTSEARMPELTARTKPVEAIDMWLKERAPAGVDVNEVRRKLDGLLINVKGRQAEQFLPFTIKAIGGKNFQPFKGEFAVHGIDEGVFAVHGRYEGQITRSNRAGKSAFLEVLLFALFGVARKVRSVDQYIHQGEDSLCVFVELVDHRGENVRIDRVVKGNSSSVIINGRRYGVREADRHIQDKVVGLGLEDFVRTCFVRQDDLHGLLGRTNAEIQKDMVRWFGVEVWGQVEVQVSAEQADHERLLDRLQVQLEQSSQQAEDNLVDAEEMDRARKELQEAEEAIDGQVQLERELHSVEERIGVAKRVAAARVELEGSQSVGSDLKRVTTELAEVSAEMDKVNMKIGAETSAIRQAREQLRSFDGVCPVDSGKCPRTKDINKSSGRIQKRIDKHQMALVDMESQLQNLSARKAEVDKRWQVLEDAERERARAQEFLDQHDPEDVGDLVAHRNRLLESGNTVTRAVVSGLRSQLASMQASEEIRGRALVAVERVEEEIGKVERELVLLRYVRLMVGRQGIPNMQIENGVRELEAQANSILARIGTDHRLSFGFETELRTMADVCHGCGRPFDKGEKHCGGCGEKRGRKKSNQMTVRVVEGARELSFDQDSGGGKALLAIAMRIAVAKMLGAPLLAIDEACASLDQENLRTYLTMLRGLNSIGFRQVFDVSHRQEVAEALDRNIVITRRGTHSTVGWE